MLPTSFNSSFLRMGATVLCAFSLSACISTSFLRSDPEPRQQSSSASSPAPAQESNASPVVSETTLPTTQDGSVVTQLMNDARYSWDLGNMERAENLYSQATKNPLLSVGERNEAWQRYALAAAYNDRPHAALTALEEWNKAEPGAENTTLWQDTWLDSMRKLSPATMLGKAEDMWQQKDRAEDVRAMAAILLMGHQWNATQITDAMPMLSAFYEKQDMQRKQNVERITALEVQSIADTPLLELNQKILASQKFNYPANIIVLEDGRRGLGLDSTVIAKASDPALFVDKELAQKILTGQDVGAITFGSQTPPSLSQGAQTSAIPAGIPPIPNVAAPTGDICLVLALPQSGAVASVSHKIQLGAEAAVRHLSTQGRTVQLQNVDTAQPNWLVQMQALPLNCAVVGGPILAPNMTLAKTSGATVQRNFFAFLPSLDGQDEGITAWRIFPSPQDQVDVLLDASRQMGIHDFGSFFPADNFGTRMNSTFANGVRNSGGTVRSEGYVGTGPAVWNKAVQSLFKPQITNNVLLSTATFGATFVPDSWKNMDGIVSAFNGHGETRQILLGTTIWGESLGTGPVAQAEKFSLAVFPSAFNAAQRPAALQAIPTADMWVALGHDFVNLGANLALQSVAAPTLMNTKLATAQGFTWAMAPVQWDAQGKARQKLMLFGVNPQGVGPADINVLNQRRAAALAAFEAKRTGTK